MIEKNSQNSHFVGHSQNRFLPKDVKSTAIYGNEEGSSCGEEGCYRYELTRIWNPAKKRVLWIMMNPSVATETEDDKTVEKCQRLSRRWNFGSMSIGNSFAYRCTNQERLLEVKNPSGFDNFEHLLKMAQESARVILAYGTPKDETLQKAGPQIARKLHEQGIKLYALGLSPRGRPYHPLARCLPDEKDMMPFPFTPV